MKIDNPWYGSTLCFSLGIFLAQYEDEIVIYLRRRFLFYLFGFMAVLVLTMGAFFVLGNESLLGNPVARNLCSVSFCFLVIMGLMNYEIGNKLNLFLGRISYEIFLIHFWVLDFMKPLLKGKSGSQVLYTAACMALSIIAAYFLHKLIILVNRIITNLMSKKLIL